MILTFTVHGTPAPQGSKRHIGNGRMIESSTKLRPWRDAVRAATHVAMTRMDAKPFDEPLLFMVTFYLTRPKSAPRRVTRPMRYPDLSKLIRSTEDGMTDRPADKRGNKLIGAWADDARVVKVIAEKKFATDDNPIGAEITVIPAAQEEALSLVGRTLTMMTAVDTIMMTSAPAPSLIKHPEGLPF